MEDLPVRTLPPPEEGKPWATIEEAFHQQRPLSLWKFTFARERLDHNKVMKCRENEAS
jgi:hypothetical protein